MCNHLLLLLAHLAAAAGKAHSLLVRREPGGGRKWRRVVGGGRLLQLEVLMVLLLWKPRQPRGPARLGLGLGRQAARLRRPVPVELLLEQRGRLGHVLLLLLAGSREIRAKAATADRLVLRLLVGRQ